MNETKFLHLSPVLASSDVSRDVEWYESKLNFTNIYDSSRYQKGPLDYAVLAKENIFIHLQFQFPDDMTSTDIKLVVTGIEPLFEEYVSRGLIKGDRLNRNTAWNTTEFGLFDPSGNRITFIEDL